MNRTTLKLVKKATERLELIESRKPKDFTDDEREAMKIISMAIKCDLDTCDEDEPEPSYVTEFGGKQRLYEKSVQRLRELALDEKIREEIIGVVRSIYGVTD